MSKLAKRLVIFAAAMVMMLASSLTVFAKENEAVPRIVDNVMYVDEGSNNVWIYGVAVSIAGANKTDIVPNNPSKKVDVMANGKVFKQLDGVVLLKDEKKDRVFLEAGSVVIEAPTITEKALATLKANIAKNGVDSIAAAQVVATTADKGALAYGIAANGKVVMASGEEMSALLKTNANYVSILEAYEKAVEAAQEAASVAQESVGSAGSESSATCPSTNQESFYNTPKKAFFVTGQEALEEDQEIIELILNSMNIVVNNSGVATLTVIGNNYGMLPTHLYYGAAQFEGACAVENWDEPENNSDKDLQTFVEDYNAGDNIVSLQGAWDESEEDTYTLNMDLSDKSDMIFVIVAR